jgi:sterol desaturase/sphingolipid hydroxylase (fatty acid hydroxylase superfamily)
MPTFLDPQHLHALWMSTLRLLAWLLLLSLIFLPLERLLAIRPHRFTRRAIARDLTYYFLNGLVPGLLLGIPLTLVAYAAHAIVPHDFQLTIAGWPLWQRVLIGFVIGEIGFYWGHRWAHEVPFLWRFHSIHHSAEHVYFLTSARAHPIDNAFIRLCGLIPACFLGVANPLTPGGSLVPTLVVLVATIWGFFIHANCRLRLGPLEQLLSTPAFHHWHHTLGEPRNVNYASMLPVMDRLFGTYHLPKADWPTAYGIDDRLPESFGGQMMYPLAPRTTAAASVPVSGSAVSGPK